MSGKALSGLLVGHPLVAALLLGVLIGGLTLVHWLVPALLLASGVGAVLLVRAPRFIVPLVFASIFFEAFGALGVSVATLPITLSKLVALAGLGLLAVHSLRKREPMFTWLPVSTGMLFMIGSMVFGVIIASEFGASQFGSVMRVVLVCMLAHMIPRLIGPGDLSWVLRAMSLILVVTLIGLIGADPVDSTRERTAGAFLDANMWCTTLLLIVPLSLTQMVHERRKYWHMGIVVVMLLFYFNVFQSLSRSGFLTSVLIAPGLIWLVWPRRVWFILALLAMPVLLNYFVSVDLLYERYRTLFDADYTEMDGSLNHRAELARTGLLLFKENWLVGVGQANFIPAALARSSGAARMIAHNTYLNIAAELGIVGIACHLVFFYQLAAQGVRAFLRAPTYRTRRLVAAYITSMLGFALMSATLNNIGFTMAYFILGVFMVIDQATDMPTSELEAIGLGSRDSAPTPS